MRKKFVFTPLMVVLVSGSAIYAQDTSSAVLAGKVTSRNGQPLQGARVLIESPALLGVRQTTTDTNGNFRVQLLPNGTFTVTYTLNGYITRKLTLQLIAGQTGNASTILSPIGVAEATVEITTTSSVAQVDKTDTVVQTSYNSDFLEKIVGRDYGSIGLLAPGLKGTSFGVDQGTNIRGGSSYGATWLINGASVKDQWNNTIREGVTGLPDLIESVAIIQSPLNSRYGNTDAGILSVVTSRGSNKFSGSVRLYTSRNGGWNAVDEYGYPRRDGTSAANTAGGSDVLTKRYEITLKGPIWKDYVTFAYGADLRPATVSQGNRGSLFYNSGNGQYGQAQDYVGTFFQADNGDIIRKSELYLRNNPVANPYQTVDSLTLNQFTVFGQITPDHQLEWHYFQRETQLQNGEIGATAPSENTGLLWTQEEGNSQNYTGRAQRTWSLAYKGVISSSGLLEARVGNTFYEFFSANSRLPEPRYPIFITSMASRYPIDPNGNLSDLNNYYSNGYISAFANSSVAGNPNPFTSNYRLFHNSQQGDTGDAGGTKSILLNYQHMLDTKMGTHMIDVGYNSEKFTWNTNSQAPYRFFAAGQIAYDLSDVSGLSAPRETYAGKYIVFNPTISRFSDIDPWGVARYGVTDGRFIDDAGNVNMHYLPITPRVDVRFGVDKAYVHSDAISYYINDLWSINSHHSVMAGVRFDSIKVYDTEKTVVNYTQPTFRAEYKWDIHGDQSRLVSVSWGQFHNNPGAGTFRPALTVRNENTTTWYWTGAALGDNRSTLAKPYLVTKEDILNLDNYGYRDTSANYNRGNTVVDPDFKAMISTEISVGFRRSLNNGGYWKLSFINRTWENDFDVYPGEEFQNEDGVWDIKRIMKNAEGRERSYRAAELEWDFPINNRSRFGGSYTFARYMDNTSSLVNQAVHWMIFGYGLNLDWWWDQQFGSRDAWLPSLPQQPEHTFRFYLNFDLSSGKLDSSLSFVGNYLSGSFYGYDASGYFMRVGLPADAYPHTIGGTNGGSATGSAYVPFPGTGRWIPTNTLTTSQDSWGLDLRYLISVPLMERLAWHMRILVTNVFNHRGLGNWYPGGTADTAIVPNDLYNPNGSVGSLKSNVYDTGYRNVWRPGGTFDGNSLYTGRMNGRSFTIETGLRF